MADKKLTSPGLCVFLAMAVLLLPLKWLLALVVAALIHEFCHLAAIYICNKKAVKIRFGWYGAKILLPSMSRKQELFCALAGPLGGLCLLFFVKYIPRIAICAALQSIYNMLPFYPLDGGRALRCALSILFPPSKAEKWQKYISRVVITAFFVLGAYLSVMKNIGLLPIAGVVFLLFRRKFGKTTCQESTFRVQ